MLARKQSGIYIYGRVHSSIVIVNKTHPKPKPDLGLKRIGINHMQLRLHTAARDSTAGRKQHAVRKEN